MLHTVAELKAYIHICVQCTRFTRSFDRNLHTAPRCTTATWCLWPLDQGKGCVCLEGGFLGTVVQEASRCSRPSATQWVQAPPLAWSGWQELHRVAAFTLCPPLHHETIHGEHLCTRPSRTLTELSPCFCLPPPARR